MASCKCQLWMRIRREVGQEAVHKKKKIKCRSNGVIHQDECVSKITPQIHEWDQNLLTFKTYIPPYHTRLIVGLCGEDIYTYLMVPTLNPVLVAKYFYTTPQQKSSDMSWQENGSNPYRKKRGKRCLYSLPKRTHWTQTKSQLKQIAGWIFALFSLKYWPFVMLHNSPPSLKWCWVC